MSDAEQSVAPKLKLSVCLLVDQRSQFPEMFRVGTALRDMGRFQVTMVFSTPQKDNESLALREGVAVECRYGTNDKVVGGSITYADFGGTDGRLGRAGGARYRLLQFLKFIRIYIPLRDLYLRYFIHRTAWIHVPVHVHALKKLKREAESVIGKLRPDVVILPFVDFYTLAGALLVEAKRREIPVVVVPYAWITRKEAWKALAVQSEYQCNGILAELVEFLWPQWIYRGILFLPPAKILAAKLVGIPDGFPWMADAEADRIACDSSFLMRSYVKDGVPQERCVITGSSSLDLLANAGSRPSIIARRYFLVFLPADQTGNKIPGFDFSDYQELISFWVERCFLAEVGGCSPVFSVHPRMKADLLPVLRGNWPGINIYEGDPCDLIPHAEYCISELGGLMRYVLACARPLIYYDVYNYDFGTDEFESDSNFIRVNTRDTFEKILTEYATTVVNTAPNSSSVGAVKYWGALDGQGGRRIAALLNRLVEGDDISATVN